MRNNSNERKECERIWAEYKYLVLSKSQKIYKEIREYLKGDNINTNELNEYIKKSLILGENRLEAINSFEHIWGYFKKKASKDEKTKFFLLLSNYKDEKAEYLDIIRYFNTLLLKYPNEYLSKSKIIKGDYNEIMAPRFNK